MPAHSHIKDEKLLKYTENITNVPVETMLEDIRLGKSDAMRAVNALETPEELAYRIKLVNGGLIQIILGFLKRCEHSTFTELFGEDDGGDKFVPSPVEWLGFLTNYVTSTRPQDNSSSRIPGKNGNPICVEIAEGIGPLVKCMRDDIKREVFKSNLFWFQCYKFFFITVTNLAMVNNKALPVLLQHDNGGFIGMIIQHLFIDKCRPDIMEDELAEKWIRPTLSTSTQAATSFLHLCVAVIVEGEDGPGDLLTDDQIQKFYEIGVTPIVNEAFDPNCSTSFMCGTVDLVGNSRNDPRSKEIYYTFLLNFAVTRCVCPDVIRKVINLGMEQPDELDAKYIPQITSRLLHVASQDRNVLPIPDDSRFATAIDSGLLEMVLKFLVVLGSPNAGDGIDCLHSIANGASLVSSHPKTSSAITSAVSTKVANCMAQPELINLVQSNEKAMAVYKAIGFLVDPDFKPAIQCFSCSKVLESDAIKRCSRCKNATYCSKDCQAAHWKNHKRECKKTKPAKIDGVPSRLKDAIELQRMSISKTTNEIFACKTGLLLKWSIVNDYDILDCMAIINFHHSPPSFDMKHYSDFLLTNGGMSLAHPNLKHQIEEIRASEDLACLVITLPVGGEPDGSRVGIL